MFCKKCGKQLPDDASFCTYCGEPVGVIDPQPTAVPQGPDIPAPVKKKKKHKAWKIILGTFLFLMGLSMIGNALSGNVNTDTTVSSVQTEAPTLSAADYKQSCVNIDYKELARNPANYEGTNVVFSGKVFQVAEVLGTYTLLVNVTKMDDGGLGLNLYEDPVYCTVKIPDGEPRILEEDMITIYGEFEGIKSYATVLGAQNSVPQIDIEYFEISE